jgi:hypothetical protein
MIISQHLTVSSENLPVRAFKLIPLALVMDLNKKYKPFSGMDLF